jgi:hypothetical protein
MADGPEGDREEGILEPSTSLPPILPLPPGEGGVRARERHGERLSVVQRSTLI